MARAVNWQPSWGEAWGGSSTLAQAEWRTQFKAGGLDWTARAHAQSEGRGQGQVSQAGLDELHASLDAQAWQFSAGRKQVEWDVGYAFRPNDMVARAPRRPLLAWAASGRPLLQAEWYGAESAVSVVWVNPQGGGGEPDSAQEQAVASRAYLRRGGTDWHVFARHGQRSLGSLGLALASVAHDNWAFHASWRWQRSAPSRPAYHQALVGASWTHASRISVLAEAWWDGAAASPGQWQTWRLHQQRLQAEAGVVQPQAPWALQKAVAWKASMAAFQGENLHRAQALLRLAWDEGPWALSMDTLYQPADGGRSWGLAASWQGDHWRLDAAWRHLGGRANSAMARLPLRQQAQLSATWAL
jgi:hypothetical protein